MTDLGSVDPAKMSGLEFLRYATSLPDRTGIGSLLGIAADVLEEGHVIMSLEPRPEFANPLGTVHGGIFSTLLDSAMGCAVHTTLPAGAGYTTLGLTVNLVRAVPVDAERLIAEGTTVHVGGRTATAEGQVKDADGRLVAHATTNCMIFR
ncbi:PaaI family thioesterase [Streptomyces sp. NPDC004647]|uniref:PaaI family thioesterase n=1 Tax=Streptomyces sp. NPDC004647 TaxID=3154671 RepID=UPI0033A5B32C